MVVIGKTDGGYILEATKSEVNHIAGYYYDQGKTPPLNSGDVIQVDALFDQLKNLAAKAQRVTGLISDLRSMADTLELKAPIIIEVISQP